jgi:hypothetical protein
LALSVIAARLAAATLAFAAAVLVQGALIALLPEGSGPRALAFVSQALAGTFWHLLVLTPWALLARLALGPVAAPWALLALALAASKLSTVAPPVLAVAWFPPFLPDVARPDSPIFTTVAWLYAVTHAACIWLATIPLLRRAR